MVQGLLPATVLRWSRPTARRPQSSTDEVATVVPPSSQPRVSHPIRPLKFWRGGIGGGAHDAQLIGLPPGVDGPQWHLRSAEVVAFGTDLRGRGTLLARPTCQRNSQQSKRACGPQSSVSHVTQHRWGWPNGPTCQLPRKLPQTTRLCGWCAGSVCRRRSPRMGQQRALGPLRNGRFWPTRPWVAFILFLFFSCFPSSF
jgi:hypothetical protein